MTAILSARRARLFLLLVLAAGGLAALPGCANQNPPPSESASTAASYRLLWSATRVNDKTPLVAYSLVIRPGQTVTQHTDSTRPEVDRPAFPAFTAGLSQRRANGTFELYTKASLREVILKKKGKLRRKKRNIGALIPIRPGETQVVSSSSDLIRLEVRLEPR